MLAFLLRSLFKELYLLMLFVFLSLYRLCLRANLVEFVLILGIFRLLLYLNKKPHKGVDLLVNACHFDTFP